MNNINVPLGNSLLKLPSLSPRLTAYLKGFEKSLVNFHDFSKEELLPNKKSHNN